jgi:radical SAM protein with 4Fe4S-binding SPASM domain
MNAELGGETLFCRALGDQIGVLCDGMVVPCCLDADGVMALGDLHKTPLAEILASPRARAIREGFTCRRAVEELCRRCGYAKRFNK